MSNKLIRVNNGKKFNVLCVLSVHNLLYVLILLFLVLITISSVSALGVAPSKKIIDYDTNEHVITTRILNSEGQDKHLIITASGELSPYVTIPEPEILVRSYESEKYFDYIIQLPSNLEPGPKILYLSISEIPSGDAQSGASGLISITYQLIVNVPYDGLHAKGFISVSANNEKNALMNIAATIENIGTEDISRLDGTLNIFDLSTNQLVWQKNIDSQIIISEKNSLKLSEESQIESNGKYLAQYSLTYYNDYSNQKKSLNLTKDFEIGSYNITLTNASVKNFRLGTIAKFDMIVDADWNIPITDASTELVISDVQGNVLDTINTSGITLNPNNNMLTAYWDTINIESGTYLVSINIYAGNKIISRTYSTIVGNSKIVMTPEDAVSDTSSKISVRVILSAILIIVAIILIVVLLKRRHFGDSGKKLRRN
jgi:hypothetical protein